MHKIPFDTTHLIGFFMFAAHQPQEKSYYAMDPQMCALAQYGKHILGTDFSWAMFTSFGGKQHPEIYVIPKDHPLNYPLMKAVMYSSTWGQLVDALRQIVREAEGDN